MRIFFCFFILASFTHSQKFYVNFEDLGYSKKEIVDSLISVNSNIEKDTVLFFSSHIFNNFFSDDDAKLYDKTTPIIFLLYRKNGADFFQILYKYNVTQLKSFNSINIFNYNFINMTGVIKEETGLKVVPPLDASFSDVVIFISPKSKFYFEFGSPGFEITIASNKTRKHYREDWVNIIKNELSSLIKDIN